MSRLQLGGLATISTLATPLLKPAQTSRRTSKTLDKDGAEKRQGLYQKEFHCTSFNCCGNVSFNKVEVTSSETKMTAELQFMFGCEFYLCYTMPQKKHVRPRLWGGLSSSSEFDLMLPDNNTDTLCDVRERIVGCRRVPNMLKGC